MSGIIKYSVLAGILRLCLIMYGEWQDRNFIVKYTDVDYKVFTDAARYVLNGESPYERATYRYTPLLAWMLVLDSTLCIPYGKLLFSICDIMVGWLIYAILSITKISHNKKIICTNLWLFNPLTLTVSTRGNAESLQSVLVLSSVYLILQKRTAMSAISLALGVHFKLYPIVYTLPFFLLLDDTFFYKQSIDHNNMRREWYFVDLLSRLIGFTRIKFALIWLLTLATANGAMYYL